MTELGRIAHFPVRRGLPSYGQPVSSSSRPVTVLEKSDVLPALFGVWDDLDKLLTTISEAELLTQAQKLTSRPLLEKVAGKLAGQGLELSGGDAAVQLQRMIRVVPIAGTEVVEVQAVGARPQQLATALNVLLEAYRDEMKATFGSESGESLDKARSEVERLTNQRMTDIVADALTPQEADELARLSTAALATLVANVPS